MKHKHEGELARVLDVAPPQTYERGADGKRPWWRRALELFSTFKVNMATPSPAKMLPNTANSKLVMNCPSPTPSGTSGSACRGWRI